MILQRSTTAGRALATGFAPPAGVRPAVCRNLRSACHVTEVCRRRPVGSKQPLVCTASAGEDLPVSADSLGTHATTLRNLAFASFWVQLPLAVVSGAILIFAVLYSRQPGDISRYFTAGGVVLALLSTFFAHGFLTLAKQVINQGKAVKRSFVLQNLVRNNNINLVGIGVLIVGLQASVGTLVSKTMLAATNAPYAAPAPGSTLISLDVFSLQASTNTLLAHFLSVVFTNFMIAAISKVGTDPSPAAA